MKKQSQNNNTAGQSGIEVRKSQKHEVNLQKNSTLYFQIGLILCLLGTFALFEMQFESKAIEVVYETPTEDILEIAMTDVVVEKTEVQEEKSQVLKKKLIDVYKPIENITDEPNPTTLITEPDPVKTNKPVVKVEDVPDVIDIPENIPVNRVQFVPIFPGCEKYELNSERRKCLNDKLGRLVKKKFDTDIAIEHGLSGVQRINVEFKVDKTGNITDIRARSPHPKLDEEALRIANKIPKMEPGKMGTTPVNVIYNLPITFKVQD
ncbi:energy transducer TonB [Winogradskyella jejuensis]|uniref:Protein TonB n=1 Tax=Winogradskyella jejuensis TaxID=1089305 RepID=A0A1M5LUQ1_9FLAO|nr:energy transducer TonB [Winogradskyella jejuensis]SHG68726.1 protein TonB [Winogradskyella jejuensis]